MVFGFFANQIAQTDRLNPKSINPKGLKNEIRLIIAIASCTYYRNPPMRQDRLCPRSANLRAIVIEQIANSTTTTI